MTTLSPPKCVCKLVSVHLGIHRECTLESCCVYNSKYLHVYKLIIIHNSYYNDHINFSKSLHTSVTFSCPNQRLFCFPLFTLSLTPYLKRFIMASVIYQIISCSFMEVYYHKPQGEPYLAVHMPFLFLCCPFLS